MDLVSNGSDVYNTTIHRKLRFGHFYWSAVQNNAYINSIMSKKDSDWEAVLLIPLLATIILSLTVFLIVLFRQSPVMVIGTISGCIIFISIYLILTALDTTRVVLE